MDQAVELVYRVILEHPTWGVAELAAHLDWPEERATDALDKLADLKLVRPSQNDPDRLRPVSPQVGLVALLVRTEAELNRRQAQIETSRGAVEALAKEYGLGADYEPEVVIRHEGGGAVQRQLVELAAAASSECLSFQPGQQSLIGVHDGLSAGEIALAHRLKVREIRQDTVRNDPSARACVRAVTALGAEVRTVPTLPMRLVVFDDDCALLPAQTPHSHDVALEVRGRGLVAVVRVLFEQYWSMSTPWDEDPPPDRNGLSPRERELLRMLAVGHTDAIAARKLNLSLRTVRRMTADLMARLGAQSRFQTGVNASQRGWL